MEVVLTLNKCCDFLLVPRVEEQNSMEQILKISLDLFRDSWNSQHPPGRQK